MQVKSSILRRERWTAAIFLLLSVCPQLLGSHKVHKSPDHSGYFRVLKLDAGGVRIYEVPKAKHSPPQSAYPATYYPVGKSSYEHATYEHPPSHHYQPPPYHHPPQQVQYVKVPKSNKSYIKDLKKQELDLYKGLKNLSKGLWKGYSEVKEPESVVTYHRPVYHPPPPARLVEVRVPKCKDVVEVPTYVTETLIRTNRVFVTRTRTKTRERHITEHVVNTVYRTKTATNVVSHYAPPQTVTVKSPPEVVTKTDYVTLLHTTTQYVPKYLTVSPDPSYSLSDYTDHHAGSLSDYKAHHGGSVSDFKAQHHVGSLSEYTDQHHVGSLSDYTDQHHVGSLSDFKAQHGGSITEFTDEHGTPVYISNQFSEHATPYQATEHLPPLPLQPHDDDLPYYVTKRKTDPSDADKEKKKEEEKQQKKEE